VARGITGDSFFEIPQDGSWNFSENLFWNDAVSKARLRAFKPFQVYACWNGVAVFRAKPIMETIRFRKSEEGECYMGEPTLFCKDLWRHGYTKIQVVPSVNVGYNPQESKKIQDKYGKVRDRVGQSQADAPDEMIKWQPGPPPMVKCAPSWDRPSWVPPL